MKLFFIFMIQMLTKGEEENLKQMKNIYNRTFAFFFLLCHYKYIPSIQEILHI